VLPDRLTKNEVAQAQFMLVFNEQMFDADAAKWWSNLVQMDRAEFEKLAADLVDPGGTLAALRKVAAASAGTSLPTGARRRPTGPFPLQYASTMSPAPLYIVLRHPYTIHSDV
jgi:hypothetical protein